MFLITNQVIFFFFLFRPRSHSGTPQNRSFDFDDTENLNPEEIINSWKKTVSEIEEYKSDDFYDKMSDKIIRESPSRTIVSRHNSIDGRFDSLVDRLELGSSADSSPTKRSPTDYNHIKFPRNVSAFLLKEKRTLEIICKTFCRSFNFQSCLKKFSKSF